jgi:hypothetical protein
MWPATGSSGEPGAGARIDQSEPGGAQPAGELGRVAQRQEGVSQREIASRMGRRAAAGSRAARTLPVCQTALEHRHRLVAAALEHPPQTATEVGALAVVDHRLHPGIEPLAAQPGDKHVAAGQRVPAAAGVVRRLVAAQIVVQVGVHPACDVRQLKLRATGVRVGEVDAAIEYPHRIQAQGLQLSGRDQRREHVTHCAVPDTGGLFHQSVARAPVPCRLSHAQWSSAGALGMARARSTVTVMPLKMISAMPSQPIQLSSPPNKDRL